MLGKRRFRSNAYSNYPSAKRTRRFNINLTRPAGYKSRRYSRAPMIRRPMNLRIGGANGRERKWIDTYLIPTEVRSANINSLIDPIAAGFPLPLNAIPQGTGQSERIGSKVTNDKMFVRGTITTGVDTTTSPICRVIFFIDKQTNKTVLDPNTMYASFSVPEGGDYLLFRNLDWIQRYQVLYDKTYTLNQVNYWNPNAEMGAGAVRNNNMSRHFQFSCKVPGVTEFDGTTRAIGSMTSKSVHCIAMCNVDRNCTLTYVSRFRYYDS